VTRLGYLLALTVALSVGATVTPSSVGAGDAAGAIVAQDDIPDDAGRIIGSPDPGPDPEHSGDRGGAAQLVLFGALAVGVGFIGWRIVRAARQAPGSAAG